MVIENPPMSTKPDIVTLLINWIRCGVTKPVPESTPVVHAFTPICHDNVGDRITHVSTTSTTSSEKKRDPVRIGGESPPQVCKIPAKRLTLNVQASTPEDIRVIYKAMENMALRRRLRGNHVIKGCKLVYNSSNKSDQLMLLSASTTPLSITHPWLVLGVPHPKAHATSCTAGRCLTRSL